MYRCLCHTCEEQQPVRTLSAAQAWFNDHAERGHEAEIQRMEAEPVDGYTMTVDDGPRE